MFFISFVFVDNIPVMSALALVKGHTDQRNMRTKAGRDFCLVTAFAIGVFFEYVVINELITLLIFPARRRQRNGFVTGA